MVTGRKSCTNGTPCQPADLAQALHCLVQHGRLTVEQLVGELASRYDIHATRSQMYDWSNPYTPLRDLAMPLRVVRAITVLQGNPVVLEMLALDIQHRVEPMAESTSALAAVVRDEALDVQCAVGRASEQIRRITADGVVTDDERAETRPVIRELKRQTAELEAAVERTA